MDERIKAYETKMSKSYDSLLKDLLIFVSYALILSSISFSSRLLYSHPCAFKIAFYGFYNAILLIEAEYQHRHLVLHTENGSRHIYHTSFLSITSWMETSSYFFALGFTFGSLSYTASMDFARRITSASISMARSTVAVSVEK